VTARPAERVEIGRVAKPHGLKGELVIAGARLSADEFQALAELHARAKDGTLRRLVVATTRPFLHNLLVQFEGVTDRDRAAELSGQVLEVDVARLPRAEAGTVYLFQLLGLAVETEAGERLGHVHDVMQTGAAPILAVRGPAPEDGAKPRERLIPMSPDVLLRVDLEGGRITVRLLPGMDEL
jgi:16S rRNA processing protein RimM